MLKPAWCSDLEDTSGLQRRKQTAEESNKQETTEAYGEEEQQPVSPPLPWATLDRWLTRIDELTALARSQREYHECSLLCFTETWLNLDIPNANVSIKGYQTVQADRNCTKNIKQN